MTLLLSGVTEDFGIVLSDRRLTSNGKVVDDGANKMTAYFCADAKVVLTFTGLARAGSFDAASWIQDFLVHNSEPERKWIPVRKRLVNALENEIRQVKGPAATKRLSILVTGYEYSEDQEMAGGVLTRISNFERGNVVLSEAEDTFHVEDSVARRPPTGDPYLFTVAGTTRGIEESMRRGFQELLIGEAPGRAVADKALELGIDAAQSPRSAGVIGQSWSSAVIFSHPRDPIWIQYHTPKPVKEQWSANLVDATGPHPVIGLSSLMTETVEPFAHSFPRTPRNAPCPCGSGKKYKKCHGGTSSQQGGTYLNPLYRKDPDGEHE